jgi:hypothetical protein
MTVMSTPDCSRCICEGMSNQVWEDPSFGDLGIVSGCGVNGELQPFGDADACQWTAAAVDEERLQRLARILL